MESVEEEVLSDDVEEGDTLAQAREIGKHPLLDDFMLQYPRCWEEAADRAFLVYQDLTEVRRWWFTQMGFSEQLERPYVTGQETRNGKNQIVLPLGMEEQVSTRDVQAFITNTGHVHADNEIILAVNDLDSTLVYYKLTSGLQPPDPPNIVLARKHDKNEKMNKKRQHVASCVRRAIERLNKDDT